MTPRRTRTDDNAGMSGVSLLDRLKSWPLIPLPHRLLSRLVRHATRSRVRWWKDLLIRRFIRAFDVDMSEAAEPDPAAYPDFNSFFTRALRADARPLAAGAHDIACPVDGAISQLGAIHADSILQAKGRDYSLQALLGGDPEQARLFRNGRFITLYLSPRDYHRIHMPLAGRLVASRYIPGRLYSVAPHTTRAIPGLFTRNERLVCLFDTVHGPMAVILVGAIFVSCMETVWSGVVNPHLRMLPETRLYERPADSPASLAQGEELGRFNMGSTVILLFGPDRIGWLDGLLPGQPVRTGTPLGHPLPDK